MHLVDNDYAQTLHEAAELIQVDADTIQYDAGLNIRAGAALLATYAGPNRDGFVAQDWIEPLMRFSGLMPCQRPEAAKSSGGYSKRSRQGMWTSWETQRRSRIRAS